MKILCCGFPWELLSGYLEATLKVLRAQALEQTLERGKWLGGSGLCQEPS